jgi:hypothetical protein
MNKGNEIVMDAESDTNNNNNKPGNSILNDDTTEITEVRIN